MAGVSKWERKEVKGFVYFVTKDKKAIESLMKVFKNPPQIGVIPLKGKTTKKT